MPGKLLLPKTAEEEIQRLYWKVGLSTRKIASKFGVSQTPVINFMRVYGINRRSRILAVIAGCKKYDKPPFDGNLAEKAYLLGLALADFRRRRHGYQINIALSTTHPTFAGLFKKLFEKYAPISERPLCDRKTGRCQWMLDTSLHPSFKFLLSPKEIPSWVANDSNAFLNFLAGYFDGEGTISISKSDEMYNTFIFQIASSDHKIIRGIALELKKRGFRIFFARTRLAGTLVKFDKITLRANKDRWTVRVKRREEVLQLLKILPIRHPEKIAKRELMFRLQDKSYISDTAKKWGALRWRIKKDVEAYVLEAAARLSLNSFKSSSARA